MSQRACPCDTRYQIARAVEARYWQTCRFNPTAGKKFTLDFKLQKASYQDFIKGENRYASLLRQFPDIAPALFEAGQKDAEDRLASYQRLAAE
jgi:pyruvate-ferredoxin/flavodoxin oxidoreductase